MLDFRNRLARVQMLRASIGAVHDGVAAIGIVDIVEAFALGFVAAVRDPAIALQQDRRAQVTVAAPPVAGTLPFTFA